MTTVDPPNLLAEAPMGFGSTILLVSPALHRFAMRLTKDRAAADDLVQDTLTRAWAARARFAPGSDTKAWLFRIARNSFLSGLRRTRRQVEWDPDRHDLILVQQPTQHEALYDRDLDAALSLLPAVQRSALLLVVRDGMSFADASDELGVPVGTVKSRVGRARASIFAYVVGDAAEDRQTTSSRPHVGGRPSVMAGTGEAAAEKSGSSRYQEWKASGATRIG